MTNKELKWANKLFWMVKGHLIPNSWSYSEIRKMEHSYFERLWHDEEAYIYEDGFDQAWEQRHGQQQN